MGKQAIRTLWFLAILLGSSSSLPRAQEWLTAAEIEKLRDEQALVKRTSIYMTAAKLRLDTAQMRLEGKSSVAEDPLEFYSQVELITGCRLALRAAMLNIQDQVSYKKLRGPELSKALKELKKSAESFLPHLQRILKIALEKRDEPLYRITQQCIEYADSAARGAEQALEKYKAEEPKTQKPSLIPPSMDLHHPEQSHRKGAG